MNKNFGLIGVGGFVAPRHLQAIKATGNHLLAACDPNDSVGILDKYFPDTKFFTEVERFDRFLEKQKRRGDAERVHYLSVCTPNYLHDAHVRLALRAGADAICEKPLVINPWNLDQLAEVERENGRRVFSVLQLRMLPAIQELKSQIRSNRCQIDLSYISQRGPWYQISWKGNDAKSGGLALNIGIHFFDLLLWIFGPADKVEVHARDLDRVAGYLSLRDADVRWYLSTRSQDLPDSSRAAGVSAHRQLTLDDRDLDLSAGFDDLHTRVYEEVLAGNGFGVEDTRPSVELVHRIRHEEVVAPQGDHGHRLLRR